MIGSAHGPGLTLGEIAKHGVRFRTASPWRRGYDRADVDRFVENAYHELGRLQQANALAVQEIDRLRRYFQSRGIEIGFAGGVNYRSGHAARSVADGQPRGGVGSFEAGRRPVGEQTFVGRVTWLAIQRADVT